MPSEWRPSSKRECAWTGRWRGSCDECGQRNVITGKRFVLPPPPPPQGCILGSTWLLLKLDCFSFSSPQGGFPDPAVTHNLSLPTGGSENWWEVRVEALIFFFLKTRRWKISICLKMTAVMWYSKGILSRRVCSKEWMYVTLIHLSLYSSIYLSIHPSGTYGCYCVPTMCQTLF